MKPALLILLALLTGCTVQRPTVLRRTPNPVGEQFVSVPQTTHGPCTNCPPARSNVVFSWHGVGVAWNASATPGITNYSVYWGPTSSQTTNVFHCGPSLAAFLTNCPAGTNWVAVSATAANGLESDKTAAIPVLVYRDFLLMDVTGFTGSSPLWRRSTNWSEVVALPAPDRMLRLWATNTAAKRGGWARMEVN